MLAHRFPPTLCLASSAVYFHAALRAAYAAEYGEWSRFDDASPVPDAVDQTAQACAERGGVMIVATRVGERHDSPQEASTVTRGLMAVKWQKHRQIHGMPACVPKKCEDLSGDYCDLVKGWLLRQLSLAQSEEALAGLFAGVEKAEQWLLTGKSDEAMHVPTDNAQYEAINAGRLRALVVVTHGPLAALVSEHLQDAASAVFPHDPSSNFELALYGQCYMCDRAETCAKFHVPSAADRGCDWFHSGNASAQEVEDAAHDIMSREPRPSLVVCYGLLLCHFLFAMLPSTTSRMQMFCMNPMQGVPQALAAPILADFRARVSTGTPVYTTNAVTSQLLAYHTGTSAYQSPALTMFSRGPRQLGERLQPSVSADKKLLVAMNFVLHQSPLCWSFTSALRRQWSPGVQDQMLSWNYSSPDQVADILSHHALIYIPEHPYKNLFNDFYAVGIPMFVPSLSFIVGLWPRLQHPNKPEQTYDGWFDRAIIRARADDAIAQWQGVPEPFNLNEDGESKVRYWMRLADYFYFPGVQTFVGLAELLDKLANFDADEVRASMRRHCSQKHAIASAAFRSFVSRATP